MTEGREEGVQSLLRSRGDVGTADRGVADSRNQRRFSHQPLRPSGTSPTAQGRHSWLALFAAVLWVPQALAAPTYESLRAAHTSSERIILDRHGAPIQHIRTDDKVRRSKWTPLDQVSPALTDAVLASEDKRFFDHGGVDLRAAASAAINNLRGSATLRGASSISMQVAAMMDKSLARSSDGRTVQQKLDQAQAAWELERAWSKQQILETYLNSLFFRGEIQGIGAAAEYLFGKSPHGLNATESALLAALIRGPQASRAIVERRACEVLKGLDPTGDCATLAYSIDRWSSTSSLRSDTESIAPHVAKYLPALSTTSTLDRELQLAARAAIAKHLPQISGRNAHDAAVVVIDNATGEVLAYVGSSGRLSEAGEVDAARAPRQAGSTLKPFIYGLGLEKNLFTAATLLDDAPFSVDVGGGAYTPQNYAHEYVGPVSVRTALASSLNVPAIRALTMVGVAPSHALLRRAGLTTLVDDPEHYGFSLALGSADVSLLELTNAYRALASGGVASKVSFTPCNAGTCRSGLPRPNVPATQNGSRQAAPTETGLRLFSEATNWLIADMLADRGARYVTFGFDNPLALSHWAAVKTGTSKDMRDNWTIGFNSRISVGVWVGNASGAPMHSVTGITGAGPIWADVMEAAAARYGVSRPAAAPATLVKRRVNFSDRLEASRDEWFARGTEPNFNGGNTPMQVAARETSGAGARILSPTDGTIIALDPDIPTRNQRVALKSGDAQAASCWEVNGESLGCSDGNGFWSPSAGNFTIRLLDKAGEERDRVTLTVRGGLKVVEVR